MKRLTMLFASLLFSVSLFCQNFNSEQVFFHMNEEGSAESLLVSAIAKVGTRELQQKISGPKLEIYHDARIVINVEVDNTGKVSNVNLDKKQTTVRPGTLTEECLMNARQLKFDELESPTQTATGTIEYQYDYCKIENMLGHIEDIPCSFVFSGFEKGTIYGNVTIIGSFPSISDYGSLRELYHTIKSRLSERYELYVGEANPKFPALNKKYYDSDFEKSFSEKEWLESVENRNNVEMIKFNYGDSDHPSGNISISMENRVISGIRSYCLSVCFFQSYGSEISECTPVLKDFKEIFNTEDSFDYHVKFLGIPVDGTIDSFSGLLEKKGYRFLRYTDSESKLFHGYFSGHYCDAIVRFSSREKIVNAVDVLFPKQKDIYAVKDLYYRLKQGLLKKYSLREIYEDEKKFLEVPDLATLVNDLERGENPFMNLCSFDYGPSVAQIGSIDIAVILDGNNVFLLLGYMDKSNFNKSQKQEYNDL